MKFNQNDLEEIFQDVAALTTSKSLERFGKVNGRDASDIEKRVIGMHVDILVIDMLTELFNGMAEGGGLGATLGSYGTRQAVEAIKVASIDVGDKMAATANPAGKQVIQDVKDALAVVMEEYLENRP
jgi:hypothetical protein